METAVETTVGSATLAHAMPGRIRLKLQSVRGDPDRATAIEETLAAVEGVEGVAANSLTGSVVIEYAYELRSEADLLGQIVSLLDVEIEAPKPGGALGIDSLELANRVRDVVSEANVRVAKATGGIDLRIIVPGALLCLGIGSFLGARRRRMPAWHDLVWYAFNTFEKLNRPAREPADFTQE
jgi:Heavy metal associated domain 2